MLGAASAKLYGKVVNMGPKHASPHPELPPKQVLLVAGPELLEAFALVNIFSLVGKHYLKLIILREMGS